MWKVLKGMMSMCRSKKKNKKLEKSFKKWKEVLKISKFQETLSALSFFKVGPEEAKYFSGT